MSVYLVTGGMGCIGAWTLYHLVKQGHKAVSFDLSPDGQRLDKLMSKDEQRAITFVQGDLTDYDTVEVVIKNHNVTNIIHLAALQVPFCRANPVVGAQVNVVGTVNVFEAARQQGIRHVGYASSIAIYGPPGDYPESLIAHNALPAPRTLYGVYKVADEGVARVYWNDYQVSSTALRPYTVYGVGRDQGLTSEPTKAMLAAAKGESYDISFGGEMQFQLASDVALQFIDAATQPLDGAYAFNLGGDVLSVAEVAAMIEQLKPDVTVTCDDTQLPFPTGFDDSELRKHFTVYETPIEEGIRQTIEHFARL